MKNSEKEVLKKVLSKWGKINKQMFNDWKKEGHATDCPWWYNERASVSTFAGAVWSLNGLVLEEYTNAKVRGETLLPKAGRTDIYFEVENCSFIGEAKIWFPRDWEKISGLKSRMTHATTQIREYSKDKSDIRLAMVFLSPAFSIEEDHSNQLRSFKDMISDFKPHYFECVFPEGAEELIPFPEKEKVYFPGTAVLINEVR